MSDNPLAHVDLGVIAAPKAPVGFAEGVLARFASTEAAIGSARRQRARRLWLAGGAIAAALAAALVLVVVWPRGRTTGSVTAETAHDLSIGDTRVELAAKASVHWQRDGRTLRVEQHGTATWHVPAGEQLQVDIAGAVIDATEATLRVEVQMNADRKTLGTTAAMITAVTVAVIAGKATLSGGGKELTVETGKAAAVTAGQAPVELITAQLPTRPVSLMIVFQSDEAWLTEGKLASLEAAIDRIALPAGSQIGAVSYSTGASLELGFTPVGDRRGGSLGTLDHYARRIGSDLVQGMSIGAAELAKAKTPRRVLLVVGDGNQTNPGDDAKMVFLKLMAPAEQQDIEVVSVVVRSVGSTVPSFLDAVGVTQIDAGGKDLTTVLLDAVGVPTPIERVDDVLSVVTAEVPVLQAMNVPSSSMYPTLQIGDHVVVDTVTPKSRALTRGEVVTFKDPCDPHREYVKRVIAVGGDTVEVRCSVVYVNGTAVPSRQDTAPCSYFDFDEGQAIWFSRECSRYHEELNGHVYDVFADPERPKRELANRTDGDKHDFPAVTHPAAPSCANAAPIGSIVLTTKPDPKVCEPQVHYVVPADSYFMMGDNRDNSNDSRVFGPVPKATILGRVLSIWLSDGHGGPDWSRVHRVD